MAQLRVVRDQPRLIRLQPDARYRGAGMLAFGGVMLAIFVVVMLGWFGVVAIARDFWSVLGTFATLGIGAVALFAGLRERWGWCELELADVAITVIDGYRWRILHTARIDRPTPGVPLIVVIESAGGGDMPVMRWVSVNNGESRDPIAIAGRLNLSIATLEEIAALVERWGASR